MAEVILRITGRNQMCRLMRSSLIVDLSICDDHAQRMSQPAWLSAFVLLPVVEAGEGKTCDKDKTACAEKTKTTASASKVCAEKSACCEKQKVARKAAKPDEKGATFLVRR